MGRLPPTRKYRKRKSGRDHVLPPAGKGHLRIKQVRSGSGHPARLKRTLVALGLKHHQAEVVHADHPALRGMLQQVRHLVAVTPQAAARAPRETKGPASRRKKSDAKR
ncbi:MAG TPA: 50S ribosomal protein L30 [Gemmatimonadales bacterium]|nr:50S ribosomal protein L30 [Gemmatimonadales bacterium]